MACQVKRNNQVNYSLKAVDILSSTKAEQVFNKGKKNNWNLNKILTELQVPKEQKKLILDSDFGGFYTDELSLRENIIMSLLADNSFTVEINRGINYNINYDDPEDPYGDFGLPSDSYAYLTVPGGTNYTERNFETPLIEVPKSHAEFNTENTIGFTRGDDRIQYSESDIDSLISTMEKSGILKINCV